MAIYNDIITLGGEKLFVTKVNPTRVQKTIKQVIGAELVEVNVLGLKQKQWVLDIDGVIVADNDATLQVRRASLEALDNTNAHILDDGHHNGSYFIVPGSLQFDDVGDTVHSIYRYRMTLVEK